MVNVPDKYGEGHAEMMSKVDREGFAFWYLHYDKFGDEGKVHYKFQNLLEGFLQRLDGFRKYAFGKICMLGEEPDLEIKGILLIRGQVVPQECIDHPQWEYMQARKMDLNSATDVALIRDYFASKDGGELVEGRHVDKSCWHK